MSATATRTQTLNFRDAIKQALIEELERDPRVLLFGEDVARAGGVFKVTEGIAERVGADRVLDTPISELAIAGAGFGAAVTGWPCFLCTSGSGAASKPNGALPSRSGHARGRRTTSSIAAALGPRQVVRFCLSFLA